MRARIIEIDERPASSSKTVHQYVIMQSVPNIGDELHYEKLSRWGRVKKVQHFAYDNETSLPDCDIQITVDVTE